MRRLSQIAVFISLFTAAAAARADECQEVRGRVEARIVTDGCRSPVGLCVAGSIQGSGGLRGSLYATVETLEPTARPGRFSFTETLVVTTATGTLTFSSTGIFDAHNGRVSELHEIAEGTGGFAGASGHLFEATSQQEDGSYAGELSGRLCRAK